ncbi:hypothetical protein IQ238_29645 [Pleurocapsales cyanobacterium LEGE 06147]|nr:hypothetical protein [Pleurocapsales cyanobacterium LEGE 06147]
MPATAFRSSAFRTVKRTGRGLQKAIERSFLLVIVICPLSFGVRGQEEDAERRLRHWGFGFWGIEANFPLFPHLPVTSSDRTSDLI